LRKLHPKLRMIRNGDREVNVHRAEYACALCVTGKSLAKQLKKVPTERTELKPTTSHEREEKQRTIPEPEKSSADISAHVFIHTRHAGSPR
jgi:hypothetical protein